MVRAEQVAQHDDGGYWYVVGVRESDGVRGPDIPEGVTIQSGWCAWYGTVDGQEMCVIRSPDPIEGIDAKDILVSDVIDRDSKPSGRIRGR